MLFPLEKIQLAHVKVALAHIDQKISTEPLCWIQPTTVNVVLFVSEGTQYRSIVYFMVSNKVSYNKYSILCRFLQ